MSDTDVTGAMGNPGAEGASVVVECSVCPSVNYAMQQNDVPVIGGLRLTNRLSAGLADVVVRVETQPAFADPWERVLAALGPGETADLGVIDLALAHDYLAGLTERVSGEVRCSARCDGQALGETRRRLDVLAYDEWSGSAAVPEILAAFVTPNHPLIEAVLGEAATLLSRWTGSSALSGYQSLDPQRVLDTTAAIYAALQQRQIRYINPPASFEARGQKIRLPDRLLETRLGTCLDLAVMAAACLEQAGLHPLVVLIAGHAFPGVWLVEECFADCCGDDPSRLRKRIALGEIAVFETTLLTDEPPVGFEQALAAASRHLSDDQAFRYVLDVQRARQNQIRPLPLRGAAPPAEAQPPAVGGQPTAPPRVALTAVASPDEPPADSGTPASRLDRWKRRLLDLSLRNRLLNFRETSKALAILCPDLAALEDALAEGDKFQIRPLPDELRVGGPRDSAVHLSRTGEGLGEALLRAEFRSQRLYTPYGRSEMDRRLLAVYREARTSLEENGANTLYLALGFLSWRESKTSQQNRLAPLLLVPLQIERRSLQEGFTLRHGDDDPLLNATLMELLAKDYQLRVPGLDPLPTDDSGVDVPEVLQRMRRAIRDIDGWDVVQEAVVGLFSFTKYLMWRDLAVRADDLQQNRVVRHLIHTPHEPFATAGDWPDEDHLDETHAPEETCCLLSSDSSQLTAVHAASAGHTFVLHGPPGTGKSQTITNLIAQVLSTGKTVLFVSEKAAALNVVHHRLVQCGLSPFCLALHSNKAHKLEVIRQLGEALDFAAPRTSTEWRDEAHRVSGLRRGLNDYVQALHRTRESGESVYQAVGRLVQLRDAPHVELGWPPTTDPNRVQPQRLRAAARHLVETARDVGRPGESVWRPAACETWSPVWRREVADTLTELLSAAEAVRVPIETAAPLLGLPGAEASLVDLGCLYHLAEALLQSPTTPAAWAAHDDWDGFRRALSALISHGRQRDDLRSALSRRYDERALELDLDGLSSRLGQAEQAWLLPKLAGRRAVHRALAGVARPGERIASPELATEIAALQRLRDEERLVAACLTQQASALAGVLDEAAPDWDALAGHCDAASVLHEGIAKAVGADSARAAALRSHVAVLLEQGLDGEVAAALAGFRSAVRKLLAARQKLEGLLGLDRRTAWGTAADLGHLDRVVAQAATWLDHLGELQLWCRWRESRRQACEAGLSAVVTAVEEGRIRPDQMAEVTERAYAQWFYEVTTDGDPALRTFLRQDFERRIQDYRDADARFLALTRAEVQARLAARVPRPGERTSENSEMGILLRQRQRQRGHLPIRALLGQIPNLLPKLKPCLLMSPLSVAQYLDPAHPPFDLVVFDEASQIPVWDAVGAIARGREAVIVGDPKQLPPTSFFDRGEDDEDAVEDGLVEDLESILDDCLAARLPQRHLRWHYRSRHESLIAFSNQQYYDNGLLTFPSPHEQAAVSLRHVAGVYDKGRSRTNRVEAEAVVAEIVARLSDPGRCGQSLGVVTFNLSQQRLIEDLLEVARSKHPAIEPFFGEDADEPVMVKNLESVQGDERDVILFSLGYGPDAQGRISMNFGPLNRGGGQRRLNVAITRARHQIVVFSALRAGDIDLARTRAAGGVADLKCFLDFAERGSVALAERRLTDPDADPDSPFEEAVAQALRDSGHTVHAQVGCAGYRIDLAVVDPDHPGRYLLGIECDGATYHRAKTARDRDQLREAVLRDLGWHIHRVWSTDWWERPAEELQRIEAAIEHALTSRGEPSTPCAAPAETPAPAAAPTPEPAPEPVAVPVYRAYETAYQAGDLQAFNQAAATATIRRQIEEIVALEGPVSQDLAMQRVRECWGIARLGRLVRERIERVLPSAQVRRRREGDRVFLWPPELDPTTWRGFRRHGDGARSARDSGDIPPQEIANAAGQVLAEQVSLPRAELLAETARMIGFQRVTQQMEPWLHEGVELLIQRGDAVGEDGLVRANR